MKDTYPQIQEVYFKTVYKKKKKRKKEKKPSPRYIIVKLQRTKDIEKNLKSSQREKKR